MNNQNLIEKIAQKFAVGFEDGHIIKSGDYISISPAHVMTHDNTGAVIPKFKSIGATQLANNRQVVNTLDHNVQDTSEANLTKYKNIQQFASEMGNDFYPAGRGIGHQIMCEEGYAWPGTMVVASDSHSNMYGGLGCLGTPIVRTDAAAIWATGRTWWQVPPVAKVILTGQLKPGVTGKDVIVTLCGHFNEDEVLNHAIEFSGDGITNLSIDDRLTVSNMTTEWGALAGVFPIDDKTIEWLDSRIKFVALRGLASVPSDEDAINGEHPRLNNKRLEDLKSNILEPDENAFYSKELTLDLSTVTPHASGPNHVKVMTPIEDMVDKKINKAYLVSCVNSRVDDLAQAAEVINGQKVAEGVEFYIAAASSEVQTESEKRGDWKKLVDAGAIVLPPGCGPCIGLGAGLLEDGEVGISATNRNFKGRMGSKDAEAYLASPAIVAASAIKGHFALPFEIESSEINGTIAINEKPKQDTKSLTIIDGFPKQINGNVVYCHQDNLNTDGIYPGKYTYIDDFKPEQQAEVVMENYDPDFAKNVSEGNILIGGFNFGTGSSREQAATALKNRGIAMVIAGSFSETYKRNAINNGFLAIECPELVNDLKSLYGIEKLTVYTEKRAEIDFTKAEMKFENKTYTISPIGAAAQELIVIDGLENWVKEKIS
jgi:homoaconitate hydratase